MKKAGFGFTLTVLLGVFGVSTLTSALADTPAFQPQACGINARLTLDGTVGVQEVFKGTVTNEDGTATDAFLIRYFDGKQETYLTKDIVMDEILNTRFYDVYNTNEDVTPLFLSFGADLDSNGNEVSLIGDTSDGSLFSVDLHPTHSSLTGSCDASEAAPPAI